MNHSLNNLLSKYGCEESASVEEAVFPCPISIHKLRDRLLLLGTVLYEDLEHETYVADIRGGFMHQSHAILAMRLSEGKLYTAGYAKEGWISQNTLKKARNSLEAMCREPETRAPKHSWKSRIFLVIILLAVILGGIFTMKVHSTQKATRAYNTAVQQYNLQASQYNETVSRASVENLSGFPEELELLKEESESFWGNAAVFFGKNSPDKIINDVEIITDLTEETEAAWKILDQITAPTQEWTMERLHRIPEITGVESVTPKADPDGLLGKEGSYTGCVYFTVSDIDPAAISGTTIVEKGTDVGGAIEIYPTLEAAKERCTYLSGFDDTILYSGSYAIVGTMVIRTSYLLTNDQQLDLTTAIATAFITE